MKRPVQITVYHLVRLALLYIRQSTEGQVLRNLGSAASQRAQQEYAEAYGWPPDKIKVIDCDLGLSGTGAQHRPGYLQLLDDVRRGLVGAIFVSDATRAGRDAIEWFMLLERCRRHNVLVIANGKVHDPRDDADMLTMRLIATIGEHENNMRRDSMVRARYAEAKRGKAVSRPPSGYIAQPGGTWVKDPDAAAGAAISAVFREFRRWRSLMRTIQALQVQQIMLPRRREQTLDWVEPTLSRVARMLHNPAYKGEYVYGRTRVDISKEKGPMNRPATRPADPDEQVVTIQDHHESYVTPAEFDEIQEILKANGPSPSPIRHPLGHGRALLQGGRVRHALHERLAMIVHYGQPRLDGVHPYRYICPGDHNAGGRGCISVLGLQLDAAVADAVHTKVQLPSVAALRDAWEQAKSDERGELACRMMECNRLRQEVARLKLKHDNAEPENRLVTADIESQLEAAMRELQRAEIRATEEPASPPLFDDEGFEELTSLCADFGALWSTPTTEHRDRKEIVRILVRHVIIDDYRPEEIQARIVWADGSADTPLLVKRTKYAHRIATQLAEQGVKPREIAQRLNEMKLRTAKNNPWTDATVREIFWSRRDREAKKRNA